MNAKVIALTNMKLFSLIQNFKYFFLTSLITIIFSLSPVKAADQGCCTIRPISGGNSSYADITEDECTAYRTQTITTDFDATKQVNPEKNGCAAKTISSVLPFCRWESTGGDICPKNKYPNTWTPYLDRFCAGTPPPGKECCCDQAITDANDPLAKNKANNEPPKPREIIAPVLSVTVPGFTKFSTIKCDDQNPDCKIPWIGEYLKAIFNYSIIAIAILAVVVMMIGGLLWLSSGGNSSTISTGKELVKNGILGTIFAICSYLLLFIINPDLTIFQPVQVGYVSQQQLEGFSESINGSESESNDGPQGCPDPSTIIAITTQNTGADSITASEKKWLPGSVTQFKNVVKIAKEKYGIGIKIASALRSVEHQTQLFNNAVKKYGSESAARKWVAKPSCGSPHVRGVAVDAYAVPFSTANQAKLQKAFQEAGWQRYCAEYWHFQIPGSPPKVPCSP